MTRWALVLAVAAACQGGGRRSTGPAPAIAAADVPGPVLGTDEPPAGTPFSRWEPFEHRSFLSHNAIAEDRAAWRDAAQRGAPAIRAAATALLADAPEDDDRVALEAAAGDVDATVRAWAALGLIRLGDDRRRAELRALAERSPEPGDGSTIVAAVALARLDDASGLPAIRAALADEALRPRAARGLFDFARLPGVDVWPLYAQALRAPAPAVRALVLAQLDELRDPRAVPPLEELLARGDIGDGERRWARSLLDALRR